MKPKCVYAGSFDPITNGHLWMILRAPVEFDLIVAVGTNPDKKYTFSEDERIEMLEKTIGASSASAKVSKMGNKLLVNYAKSIGSHYILRGIRSAADYEYERTMRYINSDISSGITTFFLMPPRELAEVSSSIVKGLVGSDGWENIVAQYVPLCVIEKLKKLRGGK